MKLFALLTFACLALPMVESGIAAPVPEYPAAEARKHIGEKATVVGRVACRSRGRTYELLQLEGCGAKSAFDVVVRTEEVNGVEFEGVIIAVSGKIERFQDAVQIVVQSASQIVPRTPKQTDYTGRAYDKEAKGDIDGAIEDLNQAIEHQPARRDEACQHLARLKAKRGDWAGALAAYDKLIAFDPDKSDSYWVRATAKEQHGDFEGAMADFTHAAELRSGVGLVEVANKRKAHGDLAGAMADYDKTIAFFDEKIARAPELSLYFQRGYAKEMKGDLDGAVEDYSHAITLDPTHAGGVYSRRGDIRKARGDLAGAVADYEQTFRLTHYPDDEKKLKQAKAEVKTRAKNVVTQPNIPAPQNEESYNKSEVTPESIAEAFVQAYSGMDVDALAGLYGDRVDHTDSGVISNAAVRAQAKEYFARWPVRQWDLLGPVKVISLGAARQKVIFSASYDASDPQTNKHASGIARETLMLAADPSGAMKIVSQREQLSKRTSSHSVDETSDVPGLKAAKAEYDTSSHDEAARVRYVTKLADMSAQLTPKILHNPDVDAKVAYANQAGAIGEELRKHPMPRNVDSKNLSQLLIGEWESPRHVYVFRADGTYGVGDEQRDKWRIEGNEYIDDVSRGPIVLLDHNYFIYACGQGVIIYTRASSPSSGNGDKPADSAIKQQLLGYWKFPKAFCYIAADGTMYVGPRKNETEKNRWDVTNGNFYWENVPYTIVTLTDNKFVFREIGAGGTTFTLIRSTKEEVGPE